MWRTCATGEFVTKDIAANWAATRLPADQTAVLAHAREPYLNGGEEDWKSRQAELQLTVSTLQKFILYGDDYRN